MSIVERYLFRLSALACLVALVGLTGVIWVTQALRDFDLLTSKGQSILVFLSVTGLVLPSLVMIIAPVALFAAIIFALNKLSVDSELIAMSAAGVSPVNLWRPFASLTIVVAVLVGVMSLWAMPWGFSHLRNLLMLVRADFLSRVVVEGQFTSLEQGFVFHYRERAPDGGLRGIFIQDRRDPEHITTYLAESGQTIENDHQNFLVLEKGSVQRQSAGDRDPVMVVFDRYAIDLAQFGSDAAGAPLKPRERSTLDLIWPDRSDPYYQKNYLSMRSELHDRIVNPLYALVFGALAFAALCRPRTTRQGRAMAVVGAIGAAVLLRLTGVGVAALSSTEAWAVIAQYLLPIAGIVVGTWFAFGDPGALFARFTQRGRPPLPATPG